MKTTPDSAEEIPHANRDCLSGEVGAHPVGTAVGAAAVGAAGMAAAAMVAGPVGVAAATVGGAVIGGYVGKAAGELIDPTAEEAFWREQHPRQPYAPVREENDDYFTAYRVGYVGYGLANGIERTFEEAEPELRATYEATCARLPWERAREATRAAWDRVHRAQTQSSAGASEAQSAVHEVTMSENLQSGALSNAQMPR
jgi:hypothetical protein